MNYKFRISNKKAGFSIIEVLVFLFIFTISTITFYQSFSLATRYILEAKTREAATAVANERMEIIRSLEYSKIGTKKSDGAGGWIYGSPRGDILEEEEVSRNTRKFYIHTYVRYKDDEFDGLFTGSPADTRPADYKNVKVVVSWESPDNPGKSVTLNSNFVPKGIEAISTGGVLSVNIQDNTGGGIGQVSVRVKNTAKSFDQTYPTDASGNAMFFELPEDTNKNYTISISKDNYYPLQTLPPYDPSVPNSFDPVYQNIAISNGMFQQIAMRTDEKSQLTIKTKDMIGNNLADIEFNLKGGIKIGDNISTGDVIYSYDKDSITNSEGSFTATDVNGISSGVYIFTPVTTVDYEFIKMDLSISKAQQFDLLPNSITQATALFADKNKDSLLVSVLNAADASPLSGVQVQVQNLSGYSKTIVTDQYGRAYFPDDTDPFVSGDYTINVSLAGFADSNSTVNVNKLTKEEIQLNAL